MKVKDKNQQNFRHAVNSKSLYYIYLYTYFMQIYLYSSSALSKSLARIFILT